MDPGVTLSGDLAHRDVSSASVLPVPCHGAAHPLRPWGQVPLGALRRWAALTP